MKEKVVCKKMLVPKAKTNTISGRRHKDSSKTIQRVVQNILPSPIDIVEKNVPASNCDDISIVEPSAPQASPLWPNDGILRQALMSFTYSDEQIEKHEEDSHPSIAEPLPDIPIDTVQVIDLTPDSNPTETLSATKMMTSSHNLEMSNTITSFTTSLPGLNVHSSSNISSDTVCLSSDESLGLDNSLQNASSAFHSTTDDTFVTLPLVILPLNHLVTSSLPNNILSPISEATGKFLSLPTTQLSDNSRLLPPTISPMMSQQIATTSHSKDEFLTAVYSATDIEASIKSRNERREQPLPPMSDLKAKRKTSASSLPPTTHFINEIITIHDSPSSSPTPVMAQSAGNVAKKTQQSDLLEMDGTSTLHLQTEESETDVSTETRHKAKPVKSIQEILDSQSTATTYTTSYCSPIMAVQTPNGASEILGFLSPPANSTPKANSQLHALLHGTVSNATPMNALSLQLLLNNSVSPSNVSTPSGSSIGSLLGSTPPTFFTSRPPPAFTSTDSMVYPCEILSQLKSTCTLPAMSSSQVSSVLSALDSDSHHDGTQTLQLAPCSPAADKVSTLTQTDDSQTHDKSKDSTEDTMIVDVMNLLGSDSDLPDKPSEPPISLKSSLKHETPLLFVKQDMHDSPGNLRFRNDLQRDRDGAKAGNFALIGKMAKGFANVASSFVEQVSCFKCKFCPFLSLDKEEISSHINRMHSDELPATEKRIKLKCPGCSNVFYSPTSLKVHLSQDHQVDGLGLNMMVDIVVNNSKSAKITISKHKKVKKSASKNLTLQSHAPSLLPRLDGPAMETQDAVATLDADSLQPGLTPVVPGQPDLVKIRVRNLDKESGEPADATRCRDDAFVVQAMPDQDREGDGTPGPDEEGNGKTLNPTEYKEVKSDLTELLSLPPPPSPPPPPPAESRAPDEGAGTRKRGRPRGSRNHTLPPLQHDETGTHDKHSGYKCEVDGCAVRLQSHDNIEYHRRCHAGTAYACPECSALTSHWSALLAHLWRVHAIDMGLYACDACAYKTTSYWKLVNIHKRIHSEDRPFLCDTCGKGFKNPKQMRNHKVIHNSIRVGSDPGGVPLGSCDVCGRVFNSTRLLRLHQDNVHRKLRPHLCNFCGYSASSRSTLRMHMRQHTGEKPFQCDLCEYRTADHNSLRRHKMRHSGDKPYKCPHCSYACIQSSTYKAHLKSKHPGLDKGLMFSCQLCTFRTVKKDNLVAHLAEHEGGTFVPASRRPVSQNQPLDETVQTTPPSDLSTVGDIHLIYVNGDSVTDGTHSLSQLLPSRGDDSTGQQIPDFEPEEITGDIRELSQISEPGELKFKVLQEHQ